MANKTSIEVKGLTELGRALSELSKDIQKKVSRAAVNAGAQVIKKRAITNAENINRPGAVDTGGHFVAANIITRRQRRPDLGMTEQYAVTVRHKGKIKNPRPGDDTNPYQVGIFNEFGTVKMSTHEFMRPAFDSGKSEALDAIVKRLKQRIDKANKAKR